MGAIDMSRSAQVMVEQQAASSAQRLFATLLLFVLSAFAAFLVNTGALGAGSGGAAFVTPSDMRSGSLLFRSTEDGRYVEAPRLGTDFDITVSGPTARARVTQIFHNPTDGWVEAVYVYPLPDGGAVDTLKIVIGDRIVIGDVKEKQQARQIYEEARDSGRKAALIEQERPNL